MKTIKYYQEQGVIPSTYPNTCDCGSDFYINFNFTETKCLNPNCYITLSQQLLNAVSILEIKNKGEKWAESTVQALQPIYPDINHMFVLISSIPDDILKSKRITLSNYLELWCINKLGSTTAKNITKNVMDINDFFNKVSPEFISACMNISMFSDTVVYLYNILSSKKEDILYYSKYFNIATNKSKAINICITNEIYNFKPRSKFAEYLEEKYNITVYLYDSVTKKIDYLICDTRTGTGKEIKAEKYKIPIVSSQEMEGILKDE